MKILETHYATNGELDRAIDDRYIEGYKVIAQK